MARFEATWPRMELARLENKSAIPDISIVIATRNSWNYLDACLGSILYDESLKQEIIVVDNASTDETLPSLRERYSGVRILANRRNEGHCRAINQGIMMARGEYILILDADTLLAPGAAAQLVRFMRNRPEVAIAAPRMLNADGSVQETARSFPRVINGLFGRQTLLTQLFPNNKFSRDYLRRPKIDEAQPFAVDWVSAACMIFPRSLTERIGLWDEGFNGYWVDADWCKRAHVAGKVCCVPSARVTHFEQNRSGRKKGAARILLFHAGAIRLYRKHCTFGVLDPRALLACLALGLRAVLLMIGDLLLSSKAPDVATGRSARVRDQQPALPISPVTVNFGKDQK